MYLMCIFFAASLFFILVFRQRFSLLWMMRRNVFAGLPLLLLVVLVVKVMSIDPGPPLP